LTAIFTARTPFSGVAALHPGRRLVLGYLWSIAGPLLCTVVNWPLRTQIGPANSLMIYLPGVFFVAIRFGRGPSVLASLRSAWAFAFFFAPPIFSFSVSNTEHLIGLAVMLIVAVVTSSLIRKPQWRRRRQPAGDRLRPLASGY
jgi:two-component system sensor histidine kinase KdpD